ncbi:AAA family ATPase [Alkaliphilus peptidifermentans]|uniref:AAA domain (Dynein-related subfamily) n=1 Tax=Alkaliphilus peptidifermentans DSM 18978 TaxID=1120976 RepID=A0A1G5E8F0_9FIRM|nr:AAA family ATPase [Alkaliphilus peptidifermentans]SCY23259.1 AAA domain (dynein-related subfamily) [Alkaliphilus peptidifermentans DSM 18978]
MKQNCILSPSRLLTEEEQSLVWQKPLSHIESEAEKRIYQEVKRNWNRGEMKISTILMEGDAGSGKTQLAKALSADFNLPYTKVTCFADMDKSDVLGSILPVLNENNKSDTVEYRYYPSEIVRAYENGWLLEIQEPTVIRDAAVLMALNSALEPGGSLNLPTRIAHRHPDFIAIITTNRGYNGYRPLNEALRDRVQHAEKLDLPTKAVMMERAKAKTGYYSENVLSLLAETIILLDETAKANAIKGVAGMRSYIFWVDAVASGASVKNTLYHKVLYKITTDPQELAILEQALASHGLLEMLSELDTVYQSHLEGENPEVMEINISDNGEYAAEPDKADKNAIRLRKSADSEGHSDTSSDKNTDASSNDNGENGTPFYHELDKPITSQLQKKEFRKQLNTEARQSVQGSFHDAIKLIVHRPEATAQNREEYQNMAASLLPVIRELIRKTNPLLEHKVSAEFTKSQLYGTKFCADQAASLDFRVFARKRPPGEEPSLAVALRIDESASMSAFGRLDAAKQAAIALYEFCTGCGIPIMVYGDTADRSKLEQMSIYAYVNFENKDIDEKYALMNIQARSNNRDGMALRIISDRLLNAPQKTKLLISISDGQPKAMPDYTGDKAAHDMKDTLQEYRRKGIQFLAAAIGQDKEAIRELYGAENTLDITDLKQLPARLLQIIARFL